MLLPAGSYPVAIAAAHRQFIAPAIHHYYPISHQVIAPLLPSSFAGNYPGCQGAPSTAAAIARIQQQSLPPRSPVSIPSTIQPPLLLLTTDSGPSVVVAVIVRTSGIHPSPPGAPSLIQFYHTSSTCQQLLLLLPILPAHRCTRRYLCHCSKSLISLTIILPSGSLLASAAAGTIYPTGQHIGFHPSITAIRSVFSNNRYRSTIAR